jgi:16S rRNA (cytidine1402-2'-O)-methyltransferase
VLYLISTPIGNLQDISLRALEVLKQVDYILCEDTRQSKKLLDRYEINKPLVSFHKFNEVKRIDEVITDLSDGKTVACVSDAGTPVIQDPGQKLIARCREENIKVQAIPGPCALIVALSISGFETTPFQFLGFPPKKQKELEEFLKNALVFEGTTICYESPNRIVKTLQAIAKLDPQRTVGVAKELTKLYESFFTGSAQKLCHDMENATLKGEFVLLIAGKERLPQEEPDEEELQEALIKLQEEGLSANEAAKELAKRFGMPKRALYQLAHKKPNTT